MINLIYCIKLKEVKKNIQ